MGNSSGQHDFLNVLPDEEFFARQTEVKQLFYAGLDVARGLQSSCFLSGQRKSGKTEILKRVYKRLFWEQDAVIPFFTSLPKSLPSTEVFCREYFLTSALQCIGFLRKDARLVASEKHDLNRIVQLAYESKLSWLTDAVDHFHQLTKNKDLQALSRLAMQFPSSIAARTGLYAFVLVDDFHHLASVTSPAEMSLLTENFLQAIQSRLAPHCLSGVSTPLFRSLFRTFELPGCVEIIPLRPLRPDEAREMLEGLCRRFDVTLASELSSFVAEQLHCNPFYIRCIVQAARRESKDLSSARQFSSLYDSEVIEGGLSLYFSSLLHSTSLTAVERIKALEFLHYCAQAPLEFAALHYLKGRDLSEGVDFDAVLNALASLGLIEYSFGVVSALHDPVLRDWVNWNFSHKVDGMDLARVRFDLTSRLLRRVGQTRQAHPQRRILTTLEATFVGMNCQSVPRAWFRYAEQLGTEAAASKKAAVSGEEEELVLPEVLSVSVPANLTLTGSELPIDVVLARGFDRGVYADEAETAWLAGAVAGAAGLNEVQQFHRRCEAIKRQEGLKRTQFWLVAEEKFNQAAMSFADSQGLYTSSLEQFQMLIQEVLRPDDAVQESRPHEQSPDYAMTIPMSADSELVAVRALEQIAEGIDFTEKAKGQVRMALMEACINIKEALASDKGKIHLGFRIADDRLSIHLQPEGFDGGEIDLVKAWGMKMLRTLMDEVKLHRTTQGIELIMVKRSIAAANTKSEAV